MLDDYTDEERMNILGHLKKAKTLWDNPKVKTPGRDMTEFMGHYAGAIGGGGERKPEKRQNTLDRYVGYFSPTASGKYKGGM